MHDIGPRRTASARYPTRAQIARAVQAARENGVSVSTLDVQPNGTIRVSAGPSMVSSSPSLFDELDAAGRL